MTTLKFYGQKDISLTISPYSLKIVRLYGWTENKREVERDMREMVDKVKAGEPLYGHSTLTPYMQGVAARNSRYSSLLGHIIPWANFVNHDQVRETSPPVKLW